MGLRIEPAQRDIDAFALYDDMREEDMMECIGLSVSDGEYLMEII